MIRHVKQPSAWQPGCQVINFELQVILILNGCGLSDINEGSLRSLMGLKRVLDALSVTSFVKRANNFLVHSV